MAGGSTTLRLLVSPVDGSDSVEVAAGMVEGRQWERVNGSSVGKAIEETPMVIVDLAYFAWKRRHAVGDEKNLTLEEFEERFDVDMIAGEDAPDPSVPATAPLTE